MSITYPPELLPVASPDDDVEVIVCEGDESRVVYDSRVAAESIPGDAKDAEHEGRKLH